MSERERESVTCGALEASRMRAVPLRQAPGMLSVGCVGVLG